MAPDVLALVASTIFLIRLFPQPIRLARTHDAAGISTLAALNAMVGNGAWLAYGLSAHLPAVWLVSVAATIPAIWMVALLRKQCRGLDIAGVTVWVAVLIGGWLLHIFAGALAMNVVVNQGPQVWRAIRSRDLTGISAATWWFSIADAGSWGLYGLVIGDPALKLYCVVLLGSAIVVLGRLEWVRLTPGRTQDLNGDPRGEAGGLRPSRSRTRLARLQRHFPPTPSGHLEG